MDRKKKIIAIFSAYLPPHLGGIERYVDNLTIQFSKLGYRSVIVTTNYDNDDDFEERNDITIIRLPIYNIFKNRYPIIKLNKLEKKLMRKLNDYDIGAVIVNTRFHLTSHVGVNYASKYNIPVYLIEHGSNYVTLDNKFIDFFANIYEDFLTCRLKKKVTSFYGVSNACGEWLKNFKIKAAGTWYNSIDFSQKVPDKLKHGEINFLYAGRVIKQKGIENILSSFNSLLSKYDNICLYIAGDGPELSKYKSMYKNKKIKFLGKLDYSELLKYYAKTDVFLYPPLWPEGLPTSILEAGLMKCAVIGTDQGGIKEIIKDEENGLIVSGEVSDLEGAMETLILDKKLREKYAKALYNTVKTKFSWEVTAKKILNDIKLK